ncbi:PrsW family glutamic-type intramembrane protease [Pelagicoccus sp. SDUM812002]|uniref:PrsW family glutamic-type intramembrane protease n=1 Tax=Pelagicoccus sp. SDUM812002 TaxID=3041266 RepID=UPI0028117A7F|nr:PrsW family glutamic-type intramembrane protease [Pelagicoccus sp. SDUM812002]
MIALLGTVIWKLKPVESKSVTHADLFLTAEDGGSQIAINTARFEEKLKNQLLRSRSFEEKLYALQYLLSIGGRRNQSILPPADQLSNVSEEGYEILVAFSHAIGGRSADAAEPLFELVRSTPPPPYANFALSLFYTTYSKNGLAIEAAKAEVKNHSNTASRTLLVDFYRRHNLLDPLKELQSDPKYAPLIDSFLRRDIALLTMDWPVLISTLLPIAYGDTQPSMLILALVAGVAWATLLLRFFGPLSWSSGAVRLAIPALLLGALSAHLTILAIYFQEEQLGLVRGDDLIGQAIYCFAGIGLREEVLKLFCFVPLIPFLAKRKNEMEILVVASLVGLGFAIEENISYFENSLGMDAFGRFVTANFFHLSLTGICGLTLTQAFIYRGSYINSAVSTFGLAVIAHGAYDAFIIIPELSEYSIATMIIFILASYQFFSWVRHLRSSWREPVSLSAHFTLGLIVVFGTSYLLLAWEVGPLSSLTMLTEEVLSLAILLVMFYREIPEEIH